MIQSSLLTLLLLVPLADAATISWSGPQNITGNSDVSTLGTSVLAANIGSTTATIVNGVNFVAYGNGGITGLTDTLNLQPGLVYGNANNPYNSLTSEYKELVGSGRYTDGAILETLSLSGLTSGQEYQVQLWVNDSRSGGRNLLVSAGNNVILSYNVDSTAGGLGQYVLGTFIADGDTQSISLQGGATSGTISTQFNGFQVRAIPEPSSALLAGLGILPLVLRRRRKVG